MSLASVLKDRVGDEYCCVCRSTDANQSNQVESIKSPIAVITVAATAVTVTASVTMMTTTMPSATGSPMTARAVHVLR